MPIIKKWNDLGTAQKVRPSPLTASYPSKFTEKCTENWPYTSIKYKVKCRLVWHLRAETPFSPRSCTLDCTLVFACGKQVWRMCVIRMRVVLARRGLRLCSHLPIQNDKVGGGTRGNRFRIQRTTFCHKCGWEFGKKKGCFLPSLLNTRREQDNVLCSSADEKFAIEHQFGRGFRCKTVVHFLVEYHGTSINERTLKRRLR